MDPVDHNCFTRRTFLYTSFSRDFQRHEFKKWNKYRLCQVYFWFLGSNNELYASKMLALKPIYKTEQNFHKSRWYNNSRSLEKLYFQWQWWNIWTWNAVTDEHQVSLFRGGHKTRSPWLSDVTKCFLVIISFNGIEISPECWFCWLFVFLMPRSTLLPVNGEHPC